MDAIWSEAQNVLRDRIGTRNVDSWFRSSLFLGVHNGVALLQVPNKFFVDWINDNYGEALLDSLRSVSREVTDVELHVNPSAQGELFVREPREPSSAPEEPKVEPRPSRGPRLGHLNPKYTFETFVVGKGNEFAHAVAKAVADQPGEHYNPLFIYGGVGLGKTHLINAIGHAILGCNASARVGYLSAEAFMNELIASIQKQRMDDFKARFRKLDALILDDVQFLAGKDRSQEEFFHTFNVLHESHRQIVLTSDRTPKEISNLEDRLRNRFEWGLIADIQPPDTETRVAILRKKAEVEGIPIDPEVALFLADKFAANIRELEGALTRLGAFASLARKPITLEFAREVLKKLVHERKFQVTPEMIQRIVADEFNVRVADLNGTKRTKNFVLPRQVAMYLCQKIAGASLPSIGETFGKRDHTTVLHAVRQIERRLREDSGFHTTIARIEGLIENQARI